MPLSDLLPCKPGEGPPLPRGWFKRGETPIKRMVQNAALEERRGAAVYREMAEWADECGQQDVARALREIADDEDQHRKMLEKLAEQTK